MSLYLCVFCGDTEMAGIDVGGYSDFGEFREAVHLIEGGDWGSRYPTLMTHADADGEWPLNQLRALRRELTDLATHDSLDSFRDVEDRPLAAALLALCDDALRERQPIEFQ